MMTSAPRPDDQRPVAPHDETVASSLAPHSGDSPQRSDFLAALHEGSHPPATVEEFSHFLRLSGLMTEEDVSSFVDSLPNRDAVVDAQSFAELLIQAKKLTPYQAEALRKGQTRGLVLGNYVILEKLGEGGMGMVFKACHRRMKRTVALKVLPPSMMQSSDAVQRFHREVEVAARLQHPNIASAHDADEADGIHFLVMECVDGPNLSALVKRTGPLKPPAAMNIIAQAARGLAHAHAHGVVHRDIKPSNLLVNRDGVVKILDMGLAQLQSGEENNGARAELTQTGRIMGTVDYMAPEQALDARSVDHRADIYSLGCTLFFLLTGRSLSPEGTLTQKLLWHQTEPVPSLKEVVSEVPDALDTLFQKMVAKKPADRQANMNELLTELEPLLAEVPPEKLELPALSVSLSVSKGSSTDFGNARQHLTRVDRPTREDLEGEFALDESQSLASAPPPPLSAPARRAHPAISRMLPAAIAMGALGIAAGIALFMYLRPPAVQPPSDPGNAGKVVTPPAQAALVIDATEPNATVLVDGKRLGETNGASPYQLQLELDAGTHAIRIEKEGFQPVERTVTLQAGRPLTLAAELKTLPASINLSAQTPAEVFIDGHARGRLEGTGPYAIELEVPPGERKVRLVADGFVPAEQSVMLAPGEERKLSLTMAERPYRGLLSLVFASAHPDTAAPAKLVDTNGMTHDARRWVEVPDNVRGVEEIDLSRGTIADADLAQLAAAQDLQALSLANTRVTDAGIKHLEKLTKLQRLDLSGTAITSETIATLPRLKKLRVIGLRQTKITSGALDWLALMPQLEEIHLSETPVDDEGIQKLAAVKSLKVLSVDGTRVTEAGYEALGAAFPEHHPIVKSDLDRELGLARRLLRAGVALTVRRASDPVEATIPADALDDLPNVKFHIVGIRSSTPAIDDALLGQIKLLPQVATLHLEASSVTDDGVVHLREMRSLREVHLGYLRLAKNSVEGLRQAQPELKIDWKGPRDRAAAEWVVKHGGRVRIRASESRLVDKLADLPANRDFTVEEIQLHAADVPVDELSIVSDLRSLRVLNLVGVPVTTESIEQMTGCPQLESLAVRGRSIDGQTLAAIVAQFPSLRRLYLAETAIDGDSLSHLKKLSDLERLSLSGANIRDADVETLASLPKLEWLSLDGTPLTDAAVPVLAGMKNLAVLSLDDLAVVESDAMMEGLPEPEARAVAISDAGIEELRSANPKQRLYHRPLDPQRLAVRWVLEQGGSVYVAGEKGEVKVSVRGVPRGACTVTRVSLRKVTTFPLAELAARLRPCIELRALELSETGVTDRQVEALVNVGFDKLELLNLSKTSITDNAFRHLAKFGALRVLAIQENTVRGTGLAEHPLPGLTHFYATHTDLEADGVKALKVSRGLVELDLTNCPGVTNETLAELAVLEQLRVLSVGGTRLDDGAGATIRRFQELRTLRVDRLRLTDAFVASLGTMPNLEVLQIANNKLTDTSLGYMNDWKNLRSVTAYGNTLTDQAAQTLLARGVKVVKSQDPAQRDENAGAGFGGF